MPKHYILNFKTTYPKKKLLIKLYKIQKTDDGYSFIIISVKNTNILLIIYKILYYKLFLLIKISALIQTNESVVERK